MKHDAFAVWITGLPASGKSTLAHALKDELAKRGSDAAVLESDALRRVLTPEPRYDEAERDRFYAQMVYIGALLTSHGVPVIFDATANLRRYRERARAAIPRLIEVYVNTPLELCMARDPKGIYQKAREDAEGAVPGLQAAYEAPEHPDVLVEGHREAAQPAARRVIDELERKQYLET